MRIGEVVTHTGVPAATLRYYERRGLIRAPQRTASGYRTYGIDAITRLRFVRRAQDLGFTLDQIRELLELRAREASACGAHSEQRVSGSRDARGGKSRRRIGLNDDDTAEPPP
jgi:DNA-binding transcriptional MerR regulator